MLTSETWPTRPGTGQLQGEVGAVYHYVYVPGVFPHFSAVTQMVTFIFTRDKNRHRLCGVWKFPLLLEHLEQHGVSFITERTQMRTTSSMWVCWWVKVVRVCSQGGSGSTRPARNLDSSRVLIHPTSRSPASLLCVYSKPHLFSSCTFPPVSWSPNFLFRFQVKQCAQFYNISAELVAESVAQTNEYYGSYDIHSSRMVFPNGDVDPWHALGITEDITKDLPAVFIQGEKVILTSIINFCMTYGMNVFWLKCSLGGKYLCQKLWKFYCVECQNTWL